MGIWIRPASAKYSFGEIARRRGLGRNAGNSKLNTLCLRSSYHFVSRTKGVHPRLTPRAFPLGLRVPRCLGMVTAQIPGSEPLPYFLGRGSFLSPGRATPDYRSSALAIPTLRFTILCLVCSFRFREWIAIQLRHSSFSRGHPSGNARGLKYRCT